ncbi:MAG TPA: hypothetical protein VMI06_11855 [Terriglobia bacterium]|nr:hypothetical protein [Terriglobia bacterium]
MRGERLTIVDSEFLRGDDVQAERITRRWAKQRGRVKGDVHHQTGLHRE